MIYSKTKKYLEIIKQHPRKSNSELAELTGLSYNRVDYIRTKYDATAYKKYQIKKKADQKKKIARCVQLIKKHKTKTNEELAVLLGITSGYVSHLRTKHKIFYRKNLVSKTVINGKLKNNSVGYKTKATALKVEIFVHSKHSAPLIQFLTENNYNFLTKSSEKTDIDYKINLGETEFFYKNIDSIKTAHKIKEYLEKQYQVNFTTATKTNRTAMRSVLAHVMSVDLKFNGEQISKILKTNRSQASRSISNMNHVLYMDISKRKNHAIFSIMYSAYCSVQNKFFNRKIYNKTIKL